MRDGGVPDRGVDVSIAGGYQKGRIAVGSMVMERHRVRVIGACRHRQVLCKEKSERATGFHD